MSDHLYKFADRVENISASNDNPVKFGFFVRYKLKRGESLVEYTNGSGVFCLTRQINIRPDTRRADEPQPDLREALAKFFESFDGSWNGAAIAGQIRNFVHVGDTALPQTPPERYRHKVRGSTYRILYQAAKASSIVAALDDMTMVIYQCEADGLVWVRPAIEFFDGRFERLASSPAAGEQK